MCTNKAIKAAALATFSGKKETNRFYDLLSCFYFLLFYCMSTVHEEGHADQQRKIDWTLLIKPTSHLHFKTGMTTNYSQGSVDLLTCWIWV